jgi:hypothetical protein
MRTAAALIAAAAAVLLAGCGGSAGDLLTISTTGGDAPSHNFLVTGDGRGSCDRGKVTELPSSTVLDAREVEREVKKYAKARRTFVTGPAGARHYTLSTKDGFVSFVEGARGAPTVIAKTEALTLELRNALCPGQ